MKIGILTASRTDNNGTDLQALAMQWIFEEIGTDAELINYKCDKLENSRKIFYPKSLRGLLQIPYRFFKHRGHEIFRDKYFHYSEEYDSSNLAQNEYEVIVVGSDQIWNLVITGNDLSFFLPYDNKDQKKFSYAASIGRTDINEWEKNFQLSVFLKKFNVVSVREQSGVKALSQVGIEARNDLDPLLMVDSKKWLQIAESIKVERRFVFVYVVDRTTEAIAFAKEYAKKYNLEIIFYGNPIRPIKGVRIARYSNIGQWITYVKDAELVVTNSYHCLSFVMNFHKKFALFWLKNSLQSNTRLENLLCAVGIENCQDGEVYSPNWTKVDELIAISRVDSLQYLRGMVANDR